MEDNTAQTPAQTNGVETPSSETTTPQTTAEVCNTAKECTPEIDIETFAKTELRVATIKHVESVPKSKKLYQIKLDVGPLGERQIVSGLAKHYTPEDLLEKQIIVVANLKPAKLMGVESRGMLLAASTEGDEILAILNPDKPLPAGSLVR